MYLVQVLLLAVFPLYAPPRPAPTTCSQPAPVESLRLTAWQTRMHITIYRLTLTRERVVELDAVKLQQSAKSPTELQTTLKSFGEARLVALMDQIINPDSLQTIQFGASVPVPSGSQSFKGQTSTQVEYQDTGCIVKVFGKWEDDTPMTGMVNVDLELAGVADSKIQLSPNSMAPIIYQERLRLSGPVNSGESYVLLSVDGGKPGDEVSACVTRIAFQRTKIADN